MYDKLLGKQLHTIDTISLIFPEQIKVKVLLGYIPN